MNDLNLGANVNVTVANDTYTKLGATIVVSVIVAALGYFLVKNLLG